MPISSDTLNVSFSLFTHSLDNAPQMVSTNWSGFLEFLGECSKQPRPATKQHKLFSTPAISPAVYEPGASRANANVSAWGGWVAIDVDDGMSAEHAISLVAPLNHVVYGSTSSTVEHNKFRVGVQVDGPIPRDDIPAAWLGLSHLFPGLDTQCKDLARIYYVPAAWQPDVDNRAPYAIWHARADGAVLPVADLISMIPDDVARPTVAPPAPFIAALPGTMLTSVDAIIRQEFVDAYTSLPKGEHHVGLYKFMCAVAAEAVYRGVALTPADLVQASRIADAACLVKTARGRWSRMTGEAARALSWAAANTKPRITKLGMFGR